MTREEAIERIADHMERHRIGEYPHLKLAEALNMALVALRAQQKKEPILVEISEACPKVYSLDTAYEVYIKRSTMLYRPLTSKVFTLLLKRFITHRASMF